MGATSPATCDGPPQLNRTKTKDNATNGVKMDKEELNLRMELTLCRSILNSIEKEYRKSTRGQKVLPKCQLHLDLLKQHQLELTEQPDREDLTNDRRGN
jgi:hypothetical protein